MEYDQPSFLPAHTEILSVPIDSEETLRGQISDDDADFFLGQLPNK